MADAIDAEAENAPWERRLRADLDIGIDVIPVYADDVRAALTTLATLRSERDAARSALAECQRAYLAVAQAAGIVYQADGHADEPGPVEEIVERIRELQVTETEWMEARYFGFSADGTCRACSGDGYYSGEDPPECLECHGHGAMPTLLAARFLAAGWRRLATTRHMRLTEFMLDHARTTRETLAALTRATERGDAMRESASALVDAWLAAEKERRRVEAIEAEAAGYRAAQELDAERLRRVASALGATDYCDSVGPILDAVDALRSDRDAARSALAEMSGAVERSAALVRSFYQDGDALDVTVGVVVDALGHARAALDGANREIVASRSILAGEGRELSDVLAENASLRSALAASERECDRWRHGVPVEGDYVCPDSLALEECRSALSRATERGDAMRESASALVDAWIAAAKERRRVEAIEAEAAGALSEDVRGWDARDAAGGEE